MNLVRSAIAPETMVAAVAQNISLKHKIGPVKIEKISEHGPVRDADDSADIISGIHQAITQQNKNTGADAEVHQVFHQDVARVFCAGKAGLHHCEAALHKEY